MAKDTYYFRHDYNARNDRKIAALVKDYKSSGYGIFWATCEMMHEEGGHIEFDDLTFGSISKDLNEDEILVKEVLEKCISKYKLFTKDDVILTSNRVKTNLTESKARKVAKIESGRLGGIKSGESRRTKQNEAPLEANEAPLEGTNQRKEKKRKEKESIEKEKKEKNTASYFEVFLKKIVTPDSYPTWKSECLNFLNASTFKSDYSKHKSIPIGNLEQVMIGFLDNVNSRGLFKDCAGLISHFKNYYPKHIEGKQGNGINGSKAFIEVNENWDYENMEKW